MLTLYNYIHVHVVGLKFQLFVKFTAQDHFFLPVPKQRHVGCRNMQAVHLQS